MGVSFLGPFWTKFGPSWHNVYPTITPINFLKNLSVCWFSHILTQVLQWRSCRLLVLLREYIIWPQMKILDFDLIVTNKKCMQKWQKLAKIGKKWQKVAKGGKKGKSGKK